MRWYRWARVILKHLQLIIHCSIIKTWWMFLWLLSFAHYLNTIWIIFIHWCSADEQWIDLSQHLLKILLYLLKRLFTDPVEQWKLSKYLLLSIGALSLSPIQTLDNLHKDGAEVRRWRYQIHLRRPTFDLWEWLELSNGVLASLVKVFQPWESYPKKFRQAL